MAKSESKTVATVPVVGTVASAAQLMKRGSDNLAAALPAGVDPGRFMQVILTTVQTTPKLLLCTRASFFMSAMRCAQMGLDPMLGHCYIIPRNNRKKGVMEAGFMLGYQGMVELLLRSGLYRSVSAHNVYEGEHFIYEEGIEPRLVHRPDAPGGVDDLVATYTRVQPKDGGKPLFDLMWRSEINLIRHKAQSQDIWGDPQSFPEMCKKTAVRRHSKYLRLTPDVAQAIAADDAVSFGTTDEARMAMESVAGQTFDDVLLEPDEVPEAEVPEVEGKPVEETKVEGKPVEETKVDPKLEQRQAELKDQLKEAQQNVCTHEHADMVDGKNVCTGCGEILEEEGPPEEPSEPDGDQQGLPLDD